MKTGIVFDIKEFAVFDGPGIRTTVFMKGCPLRCAWCHNPEGLSMRPQLIVSRAACTACGACKKVCAHVTCVACGACVPYCRQGLRRIAGVEWTSGDLAARLIKDRFLYESSGGGVTFSGGEPLSQWDFVSETIDRLSGIHTSLETSGYAPDEVFTAAMAKASLILMDLKLMDPQKHRQVTGVDNAPILKHAAMLRDGDTPFMIRIPLIPGVTDSEENAKGVAELVQGAKKLVRVELLPYHQTAGAKYEMAGMQYNPGFDVEKRPMAHTRPFEEKCIPVVIL